MPLSFQLYINVCNYQEMGGEGIYMQGGNLRASRKSVSAWYVVSILAPHDKSAFVQTTVLLQNPKERAKFEEQVSR